MNLKAILLTLAAVTSFGAAADHLVLLHTNDTHSNIDPDGDGVGGVLPRKAIIDSVRKAEKNVVLIDAGDMVQGTLYFKYFGGDVEYPLFNKMDYDLRILGNHEFDNGMEELTKYWKNVKATPLSANYDFSGTSLKGVFKPYVIKKVGKKKVGFIGLNVDPKGLISQENYKGMVFKPIISTANHWADVLKNKEKCDLVVAVTHIGYSSMPDRENDVDLARASRNIDIIIGGHSHTFVDPSTPDKTPYWIDNAEGKPVLVAQTGKYGKNIGYINIDLDNLKERKFDYEYIPVTDRFSPDSYDKEIEEFLKPYRHIVDSVNHVPVSYSVRSLPNAKSVGALANFAGDAGMWIGMRLADSLRRAGMDIPQVDLAIMNVGGIRQPMPEGMVSEGRVLSMFPFSNRLQLIKMKGRDIIETMGIVAPKGGEAVSDEIRVVTDDKNRMEHVVINGDLMDPDREYVVCTIDYIAAGNDDMTPMARHELIYRDNPEISVRMLQYFRHLMELGLSVNPDPTPRFVKDFKY